MFAVLFKGYLNVLNEVLPRNVHMYRTLWQALDLPLESVLFGNCGSLGTCLPCAVCTPI